MEPIQNANTTAGLLEWHKPEITRLAISLDTKGRGGSDIDGNFGSDSPD